MPIQKIQITNAAGFQSYEAILPAITLVQGKNKRGKSALLSCIMYPHDSGHEPDMYSPFTDEPGEIIQTMEDGTMIRARITKEGTERFTKTKDSKAWKKGRAVIDEMSNAITYAPLRLMDLSEKELLDAVLKVMPLSMEPGELETALGELAGPELLSITEANPLELIGDERSGIYSAIYSRRRAVNSEADGLTKHAEQLLKTMPPEAPEGSDWEGEASRLAAELKVLESKNRANLASIKEVFAKYKTQEIADRDTAIAAAGKIRDAALLAAQQDYAEAKNTADTKCLEAVDSAAIMAQAEHDAQRESFSAESVPVAQALSVAQERARASIEAKTTQANAEAAKQSAAAKLDQSKAMTAALERLITLKQAIASRLQIKGVTFDNGRIGRLENKLFVPFQKWNRASRMLFSIRIGLLANKAKFIVADDADAFDPEARESLRKAIEEIQEKDGIQFILASHSTGELSVVDGRAK